MPSRNDVAFVAQREDGFNAAEQHQQGFAEGVPSPTAASVYLNPEGMPMPRKNVSAPRAGFYTSPKHPDDEGGCVPTRGVHEKPAADGMLPTACAAALVCFFACICVVVEERFFFDIAFILGVRLVTTVALLKRTSTVCFGVTCLSKIFSSDPPILNFAEVSTLIALTCVSLYHDFWMKRNGIHNRVVSKTKPTTLIRMEDVSPWCKKCMTGTVIN